MPNPTKVVICCSTHNHATSPDCIYGVKEAIIELTDAEVAQREIEAAEYAAQREAEEAAKVALEAVKASAKAKLIAGEPLTAEEAATIVL